MKLAVIRLFLILHVLVTAACYPTPPSIFSSSPKASKEVLINNERYNKPFAILGPVEYTLRKNTSLFVSQLDLREEAIESLKVEALARYGQSVDAIVDVQVIENNLLDNKDKVNVTHVKGTAIAFWPQTTKPYVRPKPRAKAPRSYPLRKPKPSIATPRSEPPKNIVITPSEVLK